MHAALELALCTGENEPAGHSMQVVSDVAPALTEYLPGLQLIQLPGVVATVYIPAAQSLQLLAPGSEYFPAAHGTHATLEVADSLTEYDPAGHFVHVVFELAMEKVPGLQAIQRPLSA